MTHKRRQPTTPKGVRRKTRRVTLGPDLIDAFNAVEGLHLPDDMKRDFEDFERKGLSHDERRRLLKAKYGKPG